ncbi:hypothetical protein [Staphylococcus edaphicus]|uniref:Integrase n=1 Tax=Staphylococcus edaphicus TaxID=1955013 RepID=A0ABY4Q9Z3_9STAP|nr:hypothetical protein [Staphylococcus edaphicus]UQW80439.1 hypothetical protein MNY58_07420 [Staphylococcus edaphicus]
MSDITAIERVNHSDSNMTLRIYTHVTDNMAKNLINELEAYDKDFKNNASENKKLRLVQ